MNKEQDIQKLQSISKSLASEHRETGPKCRFWGNQTVVGGSSVAKSDFGTKVIEIVYNADPSVLYEFGLQEPETKMVSSGALAVYSGIKTGRSPSDKRMVFYPDEDSSNIWWEDKVSPCIRMNPETFTINRETTICYLNLKDRLFVFDGFAGWDPEHRIKVRVICTRSYHALFMHNMLIRPTAEDLANFGEPDYTIYNAGVFPCNRFISDMSSSTTIDFDFERGEILILGTQYAGEMKKGIFTVMHYLMPKKGVLSLHSSCNVSLDKTNVALFFGLSGTGKCHAFNTPILMFNGTIKKIQDMVVGDLIMGDDSTARKVLSLGRGQDEMYRVTNLNGESYVVNSEHILCVKHNRSPYIIDQPNQQCFILKWFNTEKLKTDRIVKSYVVDGGPKGSLEKKPKGSLEKGPKGSLEPRPKGLLNQNKTKVWNELLDELENKQKLSNFFTISIRDFFKLKKTYRKNILGYKVEVQFPERKLDLDPYLLGLWLGSETIFPNKIDISCPNWATLTYLLEKVQDYQCYLKDIDLNKYRIKSVFNKTSVKESESNEGREGPARERPNKIYELLSKYNLLQSKHIPDIFKCNSRENRLQLLAGLLDSDGIYNIKAKNYEIPISQKNWKLVEDIDYLIRSLGFAISRRVNGLSFTGNKLGDIPILDHSKKAKNRKILKDYLSSPIQVQPIGRDQYFGFELDGNHQYLLGNFTVTHNTTLSADPNRKLIGDDEHCWSDRGIFNIEGGCYAKCIGLKEEYEPDIWNAIKYGALLENVVFDPVTRVVDFEDISITENTRVSYPIEYIKNAEIPCQCSHPNNIIFLTCDAFGVLPPVSLLSFEQAMYYFISGYTAKIPGTEMGVVEPIPTFSACFGEAFIVAHPIRYANLLKEKLQQHQAKVWLINTGWIQGGYGTAEGHRCPLKYTRKIINSIHDESLISEENHSATLPIFNLKYFNQIEGIPEEVTDPLKGWVNSELYQQKLTLLGEKFKENFKKYNLPELQTFGPQ